MKNSEILEESYKIAAQHLKQGQVIAYPTEAVFGLGCDPQQKIALSKLRSLKKRQTHKGFIIIADHFEQLLDYIDLSDVPNSRLEVALGSWPGPYTWIFPAKKHLSKELIGENQTIAVRVTEFYPAKKLCEIFEGAIVSTSANIENSPPAVSVEEVQEIFRNSIEYILKGNTGSLLNPTEIRDVQSGLRIR